MAAIVDFASDPPAIWGIYGTLHGERAYDIGANGGMTARLLAEHFTEVHALEPAAESFDHLCARLPEHVHAHQLAASDHTGTVTLDERAVTDQWGELTTGDTLERSWGEQTGTREVRCTTVDDFAATHGPPDFIKIDTEGHEREVVVGALGTIAAHDPRLLIEVHDAEAGRWIMETLGGSVTQVRHPAYRPGSDYHRNHYYLLRGL